MNVTLLALALAGLAADHCNGASIYPVYEDADVVSDDRLLGAWWSGSEEGWIIEPAPIRGYAARAVNGGDTTVYHLMVAKVEGMHLADLRPPHLSDRYELLALHWYSRLLLTDSLLTYQALDDSWVETYVRKHPREIAYLIVDGSVIFTGAPRDIQRFLRRHWHDEGAWGEVVTLRRTQPEE